MAGNRRSSTLLAVPVMPCASWGWPGIAAQVHFGIVPGEAILSWGWPGIAAQVHFSIVTSAGNSGWGWPGIAAQVHLTSTIPACIVAGDGRESPLKYTCTTATWP